MISSASAKNIHLTFGFCADMADAPPPPPGAFTFGSAPTDGPPAPPAIDWGAGMAAPARGDDDEDDDDDDDDDEDDDGEADPGERMELPECVLKRLMALKALHEKRDEIKDAYTLERVALEKKYSAQYTGIYDDRKARAALPAHALCPLSAPPLRDYNSFSASHRERLTRPARARCILPVSVMAARAPPPRRCLRGNLVLRSRCVPSATPKDIVTGAKDVEGADESPGAELPGELYTHPPSSAAPAWWPSTLLTLRLRPRAAQASWASPTSGSPRWATTSSSRPAKSCISAF
jgi:hypothetical protein